MSLVIAGERSGVGKTTVTLALLAWLQRSHQNVQSFKVGPDYIDPMFHQVATGKVCRNLDPMLTSETYVQQCFAQHTQAATHAIVEGVMGLFDGAAGRENFASTAHIARLLNLPILLVLDCSRLSHSIAALVHGYRSFDPRLNIAGVVLNRVGSDRHLELLRSALTPLDVPILGILRRQDSIKIPDRHLGLVPTTELSHLPALFDQLADLGKTCFDWSCLLPLLETQPSSVAALSSVTALYPQPATPCTIRVAIAQDAAFNFYYADNLELLQQLGCELVPWSPLQDEFPQTVQGLYLGGGFPEMFAVQLAANTSARDVLRTAIQAGMPTYAECGGLMYLCQTLTPFAGAAMPMVGVLPTDVVMGARLTLGYRSAIAQRDTAIVRHGQRLQGHEFHHSHLTIAPQTAIYAIERQKIGDRLAKPDFINYEGWHLHQLHASYIHLHWGTTPELPRRFLQQCQKFKQASVA